MQVVINIDKNLYTRLFNNRDIDAADMLKACVAIRKGTPLSKHGRLIDADELEKLYENYRDNFNFCRNEYISERQQFYNVAVNGINNITAVLEAIEED